MQPPPVNVLAFVGHMSLRAAAMGDKATQTATTEDIAPMREMLATALAEGAAGFSTGLAYPASGMATTEGVAAIGAPLAAANGLYVTHLRDEGSQVVEAIEEALAIGRSIGCPVVISHLQCTLHENFGRSTETLALIDQASARQRVDFDVYPYAASSTALLEELVRDDLPVQVTWSVAEPAMAGRMLADIAREWGVDQREATRCLLPAGAVYHSMDEADVRRILAHPRSMIGSDGLPHDERPHPRLWGTFPRVLGHYARDAGLFPVEAPAHRSTAR
jgi:N-acyl-D-amino-acid deacylase